MKDCITKETEAVIHSLNNTILNSKKIDALKEMNINENKINAAKETIGHGANHLNKVTDYVLNDEIPVETKKANIEILSKYIWNFAKVISIVVGTVGLKSLSSKSLDVYKYKLTPWYKR